MCGMSMHEVSGALEVWGSGRFRIIRVGFGDGGGREGIWSVSQICVVLSWRVGLPVCRCGGDLLKFGSCQAIGFLENSVRVADWVGQ